MNRDSIIYTTPSGRQPYLDFIENLADRRGVSRIKDRVRRAEEGNLGKHRTVGGGVIELKIDFGPGYRVYAGLIGTELIILLCAGDKSSQDVDIRKAVVYWEDHRRRNP